MEDSGGIPALGVSFSIGVGDSFDELAQLDRVMDSTTARVLAEANKIEKATGGMLNIGGATVQLSSFANAASREMGASAREIARVEKAGENMVRQMTRQIDTFGKTRAEIRGMDAELRALNAEGRGLTELASRIRASNAELNRLAGSMGGTVGPTNASRAAMQNLGFQTQDFAVQVVGGTSALRAFAMQFPQASGALTGFGGKLGAVGAFLNGPWGIALTLATVLLAGFADSSDKAASAEGKRKDSVADLTKAIDELNESTRKAMQSTYASIQASIDDANATRLQSIEKRKATIANIELQRAAMAANAAQAGKMSGGEGRSANAASGLLAANNASNIAALDNKIKDLNTSIAKSTSSIRLLGGQRIQLQVREEFDAAAAASGKFNRTLDSLNDRLAKGKISEDGYRDAIRQATAAREAEEAAGKKSHSATSKLAAAAREAAREAEQAAAAFAKLMTTAQSWGDLEERMRQARADGARASVQIREDTEGLLGYKIGSDQDPFVQMQRAQQGVADYSRAVETGMDKATSEVFRHTQAWDGLGSALDQISPGLGDVVALLKGLDTGNFTSVRGRIGGALSLASMGAGEDGWKAVTKKLDSIFGQSGDGSFSRTMAGLMKGAGIGSAASQVLGGSGGYGSMIGGAIGGKMGEKLGETMAKSTSKLLKGLGDFAGPLGSILGGVAGDLLGGLIKGKPMLGATVLTSATAADSGAWGRKGGLENVSSVGDAVRQSLSQIASAMGAQLGDFRVGIGNVEWNGQTYYRVSANGKYNVGDKDYYRDGSAAGDAIYDGTDAAEAMRVAVLNAIEDGALKGISDGAKKLILAGSNLQSSLDKALSFQSVFTELKQATDPTGYALEQLTTKFDGLRLTFAQAGASVDEMAKLEQLLTIQRQEITTEAAKKEMDLLNERRALQVKLLEAQGNDLAALALAREIELSGTSEALKALQQQVYVAQDAQEAAKTAGMLRDAWSSVGDSIMEEVRRIRGLTGNNEGGSFAMLMGQFNVATSAARLGDQDAAKSLPGLSQSLLKAAADAATSRQELDRVQAQTAASLEQTYGAIAALNVSSTAASSADTIMAAVAATQANPTAPVNSDLVLEVKALREEVAKLRSENTAGHAATAGNTGKVVRILDDVTAASGGDAISVASAA